MSPYWGIEPRAVSPYKAILAGGRVSCSPLSACLFSRPEERCSADCPYFGLTLWYLGISSHRFCFYVFNFCFLLFFDASIKPLNRSQTRRSDPFRLSAVTTRGLCLYSSGGCIFFFLRSPWHSKSKEYKAVKPGEEYLLLYWRVIIKKTLYIYIRTSRAKLWRLKLSELNLRGATWTNCACYFSPKSSISRNNLHHFTSGAESRSIRIQTLHLETSPSALLAGQRKNNLSLT